MFAQKNRNGFSLVELAVVLVIIGILAAIAIPAVTNYFDKADAGQCLVNMQTLLARWETERLYDPNAGISQVISLGASGALTCPDGGTYSAGADGCSIECSLHGAVQGQLPAAPKPKPVPKTPPPGPVTPQDPDPPQPPPPPPVYDMTFTAEDLSDPANAEATIAVLDSAVNAFFTASLTDCLSNGSLNGTHVSGGIYCIDWQTRTGADAPAGGERYIGELIAKFANCPSLSTYPNNSHRIMRIGMSGNGAGASVQSIAFGAKGADNVNYYYIMYADGSKYQISGSLIRDWEEFIGSPDYLSEGGSLKSGCTQLT